MRYNVQATFKSMQIYTTIEEEIKKLIYKIRVMKKINR